MVTRANLICLTLASSALIAGCADHDPTGCANRPSLRAGSIEITGAEGSARLEDLECVQVITGNLTVSDPLVRSLEPLGSLLQVLGDLTLGTELHSLDDFEQLKLLQSLHGLEHLEEVGGALSFSNLTELESLEGLGRLKRLDGGLRISKLPKLSSLEALAGLEATGGDLSLDGLNALETLDGLDALVRIGANLIISENQALTNLDALHSLQTIEGAFELWNNPALISASFHNRNPSEFPTIGNEISIFQNASLKELEGFGVPSAGPWPCDAAKTDGGIRVMGNDGLESIVLPRVRNRNVEIMANDRLAALSEREHFGTACMFQLSSLPNLTSVNLYGWNIDSLGIWRTGLLTLDGFAKPTVNCSLDISGNSSLATCRVRAMVDALETTASQCFAQGRIAGEARAISFDQNDDAAVCE